MQMYLMSASAVALVALAACGKPEADKQQVGVATPGTMTTPGDAAAPDVKLPASGMVCFGQDQAWVWKSDGSFEKYADYFAPVMVPDGSLWSSVLGAGPDANDILKARTVTAPDVPLPTRMGATFRATTGSMFTVGDGGAQVLRNGTWRKLTTPADVTPALVNSGVEHEGSWWVLTNSGAYHEVADGLEKVTLSDDMPMPGGLVQKGTELFVLYGNYANGTYPFLMAPVKDGKLEKPKTIGSLITIISYPRVVTNPAGSWAVYSQGGVFGTIFASIANGKISNPSRKALGVLALDGHDRLWYLSEAGWTVLSSDGTELVYPKATHEMFQMTAPKCAVLGKGFEVLPAVGKQQTGTVTIEVAGGANLPVAVCDKLLGYRRCEDSKDKIVGTLDGSGKWTTTVPIGTYEATVQVDGKWLVADVAMGDETKTANWWCEVKPGAGCTIKLQAH